MIFETEIVEEKQKALIVSSRHHEFISTLKKRLKDNSVDAYFSSKLPKNFDLFNYCFFVDESPEKIMLKKNSHQINIFIFLKGKKPDYFYKKQRNVKLVTVSGNTIDERDLDKILWFAFLKVKRVSSR